jgi:hypothetical protein
MLWAVASFDVIRLTGARTDVVGSTAAVDAARRHFQSHGFLTLTSFVSPALLTTIVDALDGTEFYEREHHGIGKELCAMPGPVSGALELMMNDPRLTAIVSEITAVGPIGCFEGRVYRLAPHPDHYDSWHGDVGQDRLLACSVNLGREPFVGGELQIRRTGSPDTSVDVHNVTPGDAVIFRIDPGYEHRVAGVRGTVARTAYAGWFRREPQYADLLAGVLSPAD